MPRPSAGLRVIGERPVDQAIEPGSPLGEALAEAADRVGYRAPVPPRGVDADAMLAQLGERYRAEMAAAEERHTAAIAAVSLERDQTKAIAQQLLDRAASAEAALKQTHMEATATVERAQAQARQTAGVVTAIGVKSAALLFEKLAAAARWVPLLGALGSAFLLWRTALAAPSVEQLIGLGLYGALVMGPIAWLTAREPKA